MRHSGGELHRSCNRVELHRRHNDEELHQRRCAEELDRRCNMHHQRRSRLHQRCIGMQRASPEMHQQTESFTRDAVRKSFTRDATCITRDAAGFTRDASAGRELHRRRSEVDETEISLHRRSWSFVIALPKLLVSLS
ncbi:hypothetical protein DY000_02037654 [Brassica cretica]|uniref:Uncharacterized protein n=1 Tax=Brassica cretica TaxID=69181 RepID=A0ABQ7BDE6_BRACR|nr:hypothetical protein DY000_02037654 [Brassica cretica]